MPISSNYTTGKNNNTNNTLDFDLDVDEEEESDEFTLSPIG